jgi:molybdopterin/thiamine biosynthesis adenylyltransferase
MSDFSRQRALFDPEKFTTPITIIGAGATGSWVALFLAKMGIKDITIYDFDIIEEHNIPNQLYSKDQVGTQKVYSLASMVSNLSGVMMKPKKQKVDGTQRLSGIVFMLTDTMASRKQIYENAVKLKPGVKLLLETRMGLDHGRIYTIDPLDTQQLSKYEGTFYEDGEAQVSACGTSQSIVSTAALVASMAVWQVIKWYNGIEIDQEVLIDPKYNNLVANKF